MKRSAYLLSLALLCSAWATAQTMDSLNRMQHRGTIRDLGIARAAVLKNPGLPVNRDYTKPVVSTTLNTDALNPSLSIPVVTSNRSYNQVSYQGQIVPVRSAPVIPNGVILPGGTAPSPAGLPVNLPVPNILTPIITPIVNPIVPIITPIVNPIVPIITPITNPLTPVITPIVTPIVNPLTPIIKPIVTPIVNPLVPIIKPILPGLPIKFP